MRISDWSSDVCSSDLLAGCDQQLHEAAVRALGDGAVEVAKIVAGDFKGDARLSRRLLIVAYMGDLGIGERDARNDRVVGPVAAERAETPVGGRIPGRMSGGRGKLGRAGCSAGGVGCGKQGNKR